MLSTVHGVRHSVESYIHRVGRHCYENMLQHCTLDMYEHERYPLFFALCGRDDNTCEFEDVDGIRLGQERRVGAVTAEMACEWLHTLPVKIDLCV